MNMKGVILTHITLWKTEVDKDVGEATRCI